MVNPETLQVCMVYRLHLNVDAPVRLEQDAVHRQGITADGRTGNPHLVSFSRRCGPSDLAGPHKRIVRIVGAAASQPGSTV